jgi:RND superfamily putative drug exporter
MAFAFLLGLSMDDDLFIHTCICEEYDLNGSAEQAVVVGIGRTGRLVTSDALILCLAFGSLASGPETAPAPSRSPSRRRPRCARRR